LERLHTYHEPLERDITTYAVTAHELLGGRKLYTDLWDHKPPAIHATYAFSEVLAGYGPASIFLLNVLAAVMTLLGVYRAGKALGGNAVGLWAAAFWAVVSGDLFLEANQPNTEVFLNGCLTWAFALWLESDFGKGGFGNKLWIGLLFALASLYKPIALVPMVFFVLVEIFSSIKTGSKDKKLLWRDAVWIFLMPLAGWLLLVFWLWGRGALRDFWDAVFTYNTFIQSQWHTVLPADLAWLWPSYLWFAAPLLGTGILGWVYLRKENSRAWKLWAAWAIATFLEILLPGNFFHHYYQLWLPVLCVSAAGGGLGLARGWGNGRGIGRQTWAVALLILLCIHEAPAYQWPAEEWSTRENGNGVVEAYRLAGTLQTLLKPGETFYEWGNETELYFLTRCPPPAGVFYAYPLAQGPLREKLAQRVISQLEKKNPELFIFNGGYWGPTAENPALLDWFKERYKKLPVNAQQGSYLILMRKGLELTQR
jgi:hypothetical protein